MDKVENVREDLFKYGIISSIINYQKKNIFTKEKIENIVKKQ